MRKRLRDRKGQLVEWFELSREVAALLRHDGTRREQLLNKLVALEKSLRRGRWVLKIENTFSTPTLSVAIAQGGLGYNYASSGFFIRCRYFLYQTGSLAHTELVDSDIDFSVPVDWLSGMRLADKKSPPTHQILVGARNIREQVDGESLKWRVRKLQRHFRETFGRSWRALRT